MRQCQIWKYKKHYAISDLNTEKIDFATSPDFKDIPFKPHDSVDVTAGLRQTFLDYLETLIKAIGIHPIFNSKNTVIGQIVNMPSSLLQPKEILAYLNKFKIVPHGTPPWDEIIYKLKNYSAVLTDEYHDKEGLSFSTAEDIAALILRHEEDELDKDEHVFVTMPSIADGYKGRIYKLLNPAKAHQKWIILDEYYCYKKNAWVLPDGEGDISISKRSEDKIALVDKATKQLPPSIAEIEKAKAQFIADGGEIKKLDKPEVEKKKRVVVTELFKPWRELEIHDLAYLIPPATPAQRAILKEDIRLNGVSQPLWIYEGKIIDGRTRFGICKELDIRPEFKIFNGPGSPEAFVWSVNVPRRHLTQSQIAAIGVDLYLDRYEQEALKRKSLGAKYKDSAKLPYAEKGKASEALAAYLNTSPRYIADAKAIKERSPGLFQKVLNGELTISSAKRKLKPLSKHKKKKKASFTKSYKDCLKTAIDSQSTEAVIAVSSIYLEHNGRNDKKLIKKLNNVISNHQDCTETKRHLRVAHG